MMLVANNKKNEINTQLIDKKGNILLTTKIRNASNMIHIIKYKNILYFWFLIAKKDKSALVPP